MSACCNEQTDSHQTFPKKHPCPSCEKEALQVGVETIKYHIKQPWLWTPKEQGYYFCSTPNCEVVYFGQDEELIPASKVRTAIGIKSNASQATLCYCYGVDKSSIVNNDTIKPFIIDQTRNGVCACHVMNPSGRCCLKSF